MDKETRHQEIKRIISTRKISGQEELLEVLKEKGYDLTQATLSRDIKEMGIAKVPDPEKGYVYVLPQKIGLIDRMSRPSGAPGESIVSIEFSFNFAVIKTYPGFANSVAIFIDSNNVQEIAGTIAGDDTILIIPREPNTRENLKITLKKLFPEYSI